MSFPRTQRHVIPKTGIKPATLQSLTWRSKHLSSAAKTSLRTFRPYPILIQQFFIFFVDKKFSAFFF